MKELSTIDMYLRKIIFRMCIDLEHALRLKLINEVQKTEGEDAYTIVSGFCDFKPASRAAIDFHHSSNYVKNMYSKHAPDFPIWAFLEMLSFGDLLSFIKYYARTRDITLKNFELLYNVRNLRNACAHNSCLINNIDIDNVSPSNVIKKYMEEHVKETTKSSRIKYLKNHFISDFVSLLFLYDDIVNSQNLKRYAFKELHILFSRRMIENKEYFADNEKLKNYYAFLMKVIDNFHDDV